MFCRNQFIFSVGVIKLGMTSHQSVVGSMMEVSLLTQPEFVSRYPKRSFPCSSNKKMTS